MLSPLMESRRARLVAQIESAFADTPRPKDREISVPTYDDEGTAAYFRGRSWRSGHTVEALRWHEASLCFFTTEAFRYFLPAYMLATIKDRETADVIPHGIEFHLVNSSRAPEQLASFTPAELDAIGAFFCYLSDEWTDGWEPPQTGVYTARFILNMLVQEEQRVLALMQSLGIQCQREELRCVQVAEKWRAII